MARRVEIEFLHFITRPFCCIVIPRNEVTSNRSSPTWNPSDESLLIEKRRCGRRGEEPNEAIQAFGDGIEFSRDKLGKTVFAVAKQSHFDTEWAA